MASGPITSWQIEGWKVEAKTGFIFLGSKTTADSDCSHEINRHLLLGRKAMINLDNILKSRDITLLTKVHIVKVLVFLVVVYTCESWTIKEGWTPKNWCFQTVVLEKTLENPLDGKEIQSVHPKENQSWIFIGRTDAEAETPMCWPPGRKSWLTGKDPDTGKDWRQKEKEVAEDEMVEWHHQHGGHEFKWAPGLGDGQGSLVCCTQESDTTEQLNWVSDAIITELISLQSKGFSRVFSNTTVQKHQFFGAQLSLQINCHIHTWLLEKP